LKDRHIDRQKYKHKDRQTARQIDRQIEERQREFRQIERKTKRI
jgi:hypothetical protein